MKKDQKIKDNVTSAYTVFSVVVILIFIALIIFLLMLASGHDFGFKLPPGYETEESQELPGDTPGNLNETEKETGSAETTSEEDKPLNPLIQPPETQSPETDTSETEIQTETEIGTETSETVQTETGPADPSQNGQNQQPEPPPDDYLNEPPRTLPEFRPSDMEQLYPDTVLKSTDDGGREYLDRITFLGDSTTYGLKPYKMLRDGKNTKQVWTPVSGTLTLSQANIVKIYYPDEDCEITIAEAAAKKKPDILVITLGVNGISFMKEDYFVSEYEKLINSIKESSPETHIILQSILPVARSYANQEQINNEKIRAANLWIAALAQKCEVKYLDTNSALCDSAGYLPENYQNGDGMHLNEVSFQIELDYIRTHMLDDTPSATSGS